METLRILSIDIGILNLGYVYAKILIEPQSFTFKRKAIQENTIYKPLTNNVTVMDCNRIDITHMRHNRVCREECKLFHQRCIPDYIDHFIQETPYFEECDILLLEQQPPQGIQTVQDLLFVKFRHKVRLLSPASMHLYFQLPKLSEDAYNLRKQKSERISQIYLSDFSTFTNNTRKHDISDALLMVLYFYKLKMDYLIECTAPERVPGIDFEQFRFIQEPM